jgi:hypothetical protein
MASVSSPWRFRQRRAESQALKPPRRPERGAAVERSDSVFFLPRWWSPVLRALADERGDVVAALPRARMSPVDLMWATLARDRW